MKRFLIVLLTCMLLLTVSGLVFAGGQKEKGEPESSSAEESGGTEQTAEKKPWKIGFNNYSDSHEFCYKVHDGIKEAAEKAGVELVYAEAQMDASKVMSNLENFVIQGVDAIFEFNWLPEVTANFASKYPDLVVVAGDVKADGAYYFGANNLEAGKVLGRYLAEKVKEEWGGTVNAVAICYYQAGGEELNKRMGGIIQGFEETYPEFPEDKVFWFDNNGDALKSKQIVTDFLSANPDTSNIVIATNNDEGGVGALSAVETAGRSDDVFIISHGGDTPFQENIRAGKGDVWIGSVAYTPELYGKYLIPWMVDILEGKDVPDSMNPEHFVLTKNNIDEYYPQ